MPIDVFVPATYYDTGSGEAVGPFLEMGTDTPKPGETMRTLGTWSLASGGPDADDDVSAQQGWPWTTRWLDYDPSNGLNSDGDIFKYGGNYSGGTFIRNGKPNR